MVEELIKQWEDNKHEFENYLKTNIQQEYSDYEEFIIKLFKICFKQYDIDEMKIIDHGSYQGTQIFIIPLKTNEPSIEDYVITHNHYGSCSGCDTIQWIHEYSYDELPDQRQIKEYMTLALHLVQRMTIIKDEAS